MFSIDPYTCDIISSALASLVSGLILRDSPNHTMEIVTYMSLLGYAPVMRNLKKLRLTLSKKSVDSIGSDMRKTESPLKRLHTDVKVSSSMAPCLEVLELDVPCSVSVHIDPVLPLRSIIVVTAGRLELKHLCDLSSCHAPKDTLKQLYIHSGAPIDHKEWLKRYYRKELWEQMRPLRRYKVRRDGWTLQMPASLHHATCKSAIALPVLSAWCGLVCPSFVTKHGQARALIST